MIAAKVDSASRAPHPGFADLVAGHGSQACLLAASLWWRVLGHRDPPRRQWHSACPAWHGVSVKTMLVHWLRSGEEPSAARRSSR